MRKLFLLFTSLFILSLSIQAQQASSGTFSGRVTDPSGGVIVGAKVRAANLATGIKREVVTNSEGIYAITNLAPGDYQLSIESNGFQKRVFLSISLEVGQNVSRDVQMD